MLFLTGIGTTLLSFLFTPAAKKLAWKIGIVDVPKDWRRMHKIPVPRTGGIAIFTAISAGILAIILTADTNSVFLLSALIGAAAVFAVGLWDDAADLPALLRLLVQTAAGCTVCLWNGIDGWKILPALLWILALTNAHNFIDGMDGLFPGCASIEGFALCLLYFLSGTPRNGLLPAAVSGACLGFLFHNRHPASIFAGDCGSATVGFLLGAASLPAFTTGEWTFSTLSPLFLFAYPLTDLLTAVTRRIFRGKNIFAADRAHLHHRISAAGLGQTATVGCLLLLSASLSAVGTALISPDFVPAAVGAILFTVVLMETIRHYILLFAEKG